MPNLKDNILKENLNFKLLLKELSLKKSDQEELAFQHFSQEQVLELWLSKEASQLNINDN